MDLMLVTFHTISGRCASATSTSKLEEIVKSASDRSSTIKPSSVWEFRNGAFTGSKTGPSVHVKYSAGKITRKT
ncbi:hypothetical protein DID80_05085 [Candidatus Marinamargulisbacteria bacterium SCGC AAA071-K20]|nr:hypothetical protein DID80_05085 [Candidatus Marinamargulisbacteria bacterium SCGC AAA071-K20]